MNTLPEATRLEELLAQLEAAGHTAAWGADEEADRPVRRYWLEVDGRRVIAGQSSLGSFLPAAEAWLEGLLIAAGG